MMSRLWSALSVSGTLVTPDRTLGVSLVAGEAGEDCLDVRVYGLSTSG